jgi:hypothetical protein
MLKTILRQCKKIHNKTTILIAAMTITLPLSQKFYWTPGGPLKHFSLTDGAATLCHTITADIKHYQHSLQYLQLLTHTSNFVDPMTRHCVDHKPHFKNHHYEVTIPTQKTSSLFFPQYASCSLTENFQHSTYSLSYSLPLLLYFILLQILLELIL